MRAILLFIAAAALAPAVALADFSGRVVKIQDGDTLTVLFAIRPLVCRARSRGQDRS